MTVIPLGRTLLHGSSNLPGSCDAPSRHVGPDGPSSPIWSCSVWGFPCHRHYWRRGALLPHHFTLTPIAQGGIFSVALSVNGPWRPPPGRYPAHRSVEFGLSSPRLRSLTCPPKQAHRGGTISVRRPAATARPSS